MEIQLGATDEGHIIRTLEYWDNERRRFPQYEHIAVIVAEEITGRFLNVINLFNQAIPLIAIQMSALDVGGVLTLHATKVLDLALPALEEEDEPGQETDRRYWEGRSSPATLKMTDDLLRLINEQGPPMALKYNKQYIGLQRDGVPDNFVSLTPRRQHVLWVVKVDRYEELDARLEDSGLQVMSYDKRWRQYRLHLVPGDVVKHEALIIELIRRARDLPAGTPESAEP